VGLRRNGYSNEKAMFVQESFKKSFDWLKTVEEFQREFYNIGSEYASIPEVLTLFNSFKNEDENTVDVRPYLTLCWHLGSDKTIQTEEIKAIQERIYEMYGVTQDNTDNKRLQKLIQDIFEIPAKEESKLLNANNGPLGVEGDDDDAKAKTDALRHQLSLCIEFTKLIADEVAERLPKTYPSIQERDKPNLKQKSA